MKPPISDDGAGVRRALRLVGLLGFLVSAGILTGLWAGFKLDGVFQGGGILTAGGILAGLVLGLVLAGVLVLRETDANKRNK